MFGTDEKSDYELIAEYELNESLGSIISIESEAQETLELGNILTNSLSEENEYKTEYQTTLKVDISSTEMVENIIIKDEKKVLKMKKKFSKQIHLK